MFKLTSYTLPNFELSFGFISGHDEVEKLANLFYERLKTEFYNQGVIAFNLSRENVNYICKLPIRVTYKTGEDGESKPDLTDVIDTFNSIYRRYMDGIKAEIELSELRIQTLCAEASKFSHEYAVFLGAYPEES